MFNILKSNGLSNKSNGGFNVVKLKTKQMNVKKKNFNIELIKKKKKYFLKICIHFFIVVVVPM